MGLASRGEVCPAEPPSGERLVEARADDEHVEVVAFTGENGSVSKMAIVRSRLARVLGRYLLGQPIAAGGMATVHLGRLVGPAGFSRTVAVKRLHAHLAQNPDFVQRFVDEASIASRVRHGNVVQTLDVVVIDEEVLLVLDYVHGESFARLRRRASAAGTPIPPKVAAGIVIGVLRGLHAAHEAKSAKGAPLELVHCDVSPQNILVGADGVARVLDFGIAKAAGRAHETLTKDIKGKLAYMPPEQVAGEELDRRSDLFAVGVVLWEALAGERLFRGEDAATTMHAIYNREAPLLAERDLGVCAAVDDVLARALAKNIEERFDSAMSMARALESALPPASDREVAEWVEAVAGDILEERAASVASFEGDESGSSKARLFAATPESGVTARRDALVPPPLDSVTNEHTTLRGPAGSMPTLQIEAAAALAAVPPPSALERSSPSSNDALSGSGSGSAAGSSGSGVQRAMPTPLVMVAPADPCADTPESGVTRIEPVEMRPRFFRTPIPMPFSIPPREPRRARRSMLQVAALIVAPSLIVMLGIMGVRSAADARSAQRAAAAPPPGAAPTAMATAPAPPAAEPTPVVPSSPIASPPPQASGPSPAAAPTARPRTPRPGHRAPRVKLPVPVAVNR
ncbi:MAG: serine/threonine protein kinase [Myxococcaceae bacterium]|nr:serine/threonine protein kinase [Myxococcaceae bacterium]MEA2750511.1 eukaryotic-like serine/threonine-protein kinase [Myxococcales bacterium]